MLWSDTDTMLTARLRVPIAVVEQQLVDTTDSEYPNNGRGGASHHELATVGRGGPCRVHEATDPGRVDEGDTSQVDRDGGRSVLQDLAEDPAQGLDRREIEFAVEGDHNFGLHPRHRPPQVLSISRANSSGRGQIHQQEL